MHACWHRLGPDQRQPSRASTDARSPAPSEPRPAPTGPQPTVTRSQEARLTAPPPAPLGLRFLALLGLGFVPPPEPQPCAHCASIAYALLPAARIPLYRHRADPESSSRSLPSGSPARLARIAPTACRHPHPSMSPPSRSRAHRPPIAPTVRRHPHRAPSLSSRCGGPRALTGKNRTVCIPFSPNAQKGPLPGNIRPKCMLFEIKMATSSPHASISGRNRAIQDTWRANLAAKGPFSRRGARNHAWREDVASAARPFRGSGMRHGRTGFAPCGAGLACLPHAPPLSSRPRSSPPSYTRRASPPALCPPRLAIRQAAHCGRGEPPIGLFLLPSCCPRRRIVPTDARSPAPPEPQPAPPEPQPEPTEPRPRANRASPTRGAICAHPRPAARRASPCRGFRCGSGNSREMVR